jgi:hypothetical protein
MPKISLIDYKRVIGLFRRTITVAIPEELVARKGTTTVGRRRAKQAEQGLADSVRSAFDGLGRRTFRGDVAVHLELRGISLDRPSEATRTVKAIVDSLKGPVYPDDRSVALLDVELVQGPRQAEIAVCSAREYADAFDILSGVSRERDHDFGTGDSWGDLLSRGDPWSWDRESPMDEEDLDLTLENLAYLESGGAHLSTKLDAELAQFDRRRIREHRRASLLAMPYTPVDRPGLPSLAGRLWNDNKRVPAPSRIYLPAPRGNGAASDSWTRIAREGFANHLAQWREIVPVLEDAPIALDIAIGQDGAGSFDVDNLAARVIRAFQATAPGVPSPTAYRVYRRHGENGAVVVSLHSTRRAANLRTFLAGSPLALAALRPDPDGPVYRRRPIDDRIYRQVRAEDVLSRGVAGPGTTAAD